MSDFDCCKDGKCDDFVQQVNDGMAEAMAHKFDVPVIYGTGPRIYTTDADGVGIRREPDWANVEDLEKAGRKVFVTKGDAG